MTPAGDRTDGEEAWVKRFKFLEDKGYLLRSRYRPDWKPSWITESGEVDTKARYAAEDHVKNWYDFLLDAKRLRDGKIVMLKHVKSTSPEIPIGRYVSSPELRDAEQNHCIPLLDVLEDPLDSEYSILVLPLLRRIELPSVQTVGECIDFMRQTLEGLDFLHEHEIAHRDCAKGNLMMDARRIFPDGWHPMDPASLPNLQPTEGLSRTETGGVRYYFIDFGLATRGESLVLGKDGQERAPELETGDETLYDPFKLDIYILGKAFEAYMCRDTRGAEFIVKPLVKMMTIKDPKRRPTAAECLDRLRRLTKSLSPRVTARQLREYRPNQETVARTLVMDVMIWMEDLWRKPAKQPEEVTPLDSYWD
ncbi:hypothetical protein FRC02_008058 [Tulasnella sp. 418]|nr:hypothetical protein FRC02_008058 [Tulasnella sp. 418]